MASASDPVIPIQVTYIGTRTATNDAASYTFTNTGIGDAFEGRIIVVGAVTWSASGSRTVNSVTVGGIGATRLNLSGHISSHIVSVWAAAVPTGDRVTVAINGTNNKANCGISIWSLADAEGYQSEGLPDALGEQQETNSTTRTFSSVKNGDVIIAVGRMRDAHNGTYTLSGVTERFQQRVESGVSAHLGGDVEVSSNQSDYDVTSSTTSSSPYSAHFAVTRIYKP